MNNGSGNRAARAPAPASPETLNITRKKIKDLLLQSDAFRALPASQQQDIAKHTVEIASYLAEPEGFQANQLPKPSATVPPDPYAVGLADNRRGRDGRESGQFEAQAAREGARVAGLLLQQVNFPDFVAGLIDGVFHSIVQSSIQQMEAYGRLVADVAKTLNQFRDENVSANQGRDHLVDTFPDFFEIDTGESFFGEGGGPRVRLREGADEDEALRRVNELPIEGEPISSLDDETIEEKLVPAARMQLATSRQQLLATMVLMGINRIIVTDGRISAKVLYEFQARDNLRWQKSATQFDYDPELRSYTGSGEYESESEGGERSYSRDKEGKTDYQRRDASYYSKGNYKYSNQPVLNAVTAYQETGDAALQARASLAGEVRVNFKSETFPLERMADSFQIGQIQDAAQPSARRPGRGAAAVNGSSGTSPAAQPSPAAATPNAG
ncbi:MAG: hypothetical protein KDJ52_02385 [Anaerolineae bacterium]|nr:hypothetical protein [Anaerolineae bacterium]